MDLLLVKVMRPEMVMTHPAEHRRQVGDRTGGTEGEGTGALRLCRDTRLGSARGFNNYQDMETAKR